MTGMIPDTHIHTPLCKHARGLPAEYAATARARGLPEICITDHAPAPDGYDAGCRMAPGQLAAYREWVAAAAAAAGGLPVRCGIEADYYAGCEAWLPAWLEAQAFDLVIGSVHFLDAWGFDNPANLPVWERVDVVRTWERYFGRVARLADLGCFDVLGHMDLPKKFGHRLDPARARELAAPALDRLAAAGMAVEINTGGLRKPVGEMYPEESLLVMARERGIPVCFGSDAHAPTEVGLGFDRAVALALHAGYTEYVRFEGRRRRSVPLPDPAAVAAAIGGGAARPA